MIHVRQANSNDAASIAPLFDAYRQFYGKDKEPELALFFVSERLKNGESTIFVASDDEGRATGFTQLYPSFSSVSAGPIYVLNDLFVVPGARGAGVGRALLDAAAAFGRDQSALRLALSTARTNVSAQKLYEKNGWVRDGSYFDYSLEL